MDADAGETNPDVTAPAGPASLGRVRLDVLRCTNPHGGRDRSAIVIALNNIVVVGSCGGPYAVLSTHMIEREQIDRALGRTDHAR